MNNDKQTTRIQKSEIHMTYPNCLTCFCHITKRKKNKTKHYCWYKSAKRTMYLVSIPNSKLSPRFMSSKCKGEKTKNGIILHIVSVIKSTIQKIDKSEKILGGKEIMFECPTVLRS